MNIVGDDFTGKALGAHLSTALSIVLQRFRRVPTIEALGITAAGHIV